MLTASYLYAGLSDYFQGYGCADNEHLLYTHYGRNTTLAEIIDQLVDDSWADNPDSYIWTGVSDNDILNALLGMPGGVRAKYESGAIAECSANMGRLTKCPYCNVELGWEEDCPECGEGLYDDEFPIFVVMLRYEE